MKHRRRWYDKLPVRNERVGFWVLLCLIVVMTTGCSTFPGWGQIFSPDAAGSQSTRGPISVPVRERITDRNGRTVGYVERWEQRPRPRN